MLVNLLVLKQLVGLDLPVLHAGEKHLQNILLQNPKAHLVQPLFLSLLYQKTADFLHQSVGLPGKNQFTPVGGKDNPLLQTAVSLLPLSVPLRHILDAVLAEHVVLAETQQPRISFFHLLAENISADVAQDLGAEHVPAPLH